MPSWSLAVPGEAKTGHAKRGPLDARAERSDGPSQGSQPLLTCRGAQSEGRARARQDALASTSDLPALFERRERSEQSEFDGTAPPGWPAPRSSTTGCPERSAGTRQVGPPFFCLLFFGGAKKRRCTAGDISRPPASVQKQKAIRSPGDLQQRQLPTIRRMDSGLRRNDGERERGAGGRDRPHGIPACAGTTIKKRLQIHLLGQNVALDLAGTAADRPHA